MFMSTGLVSVLANGSVHMKIVAGSNGEKDGEVARVIRSLGHLPSRQEAYHLAQRVGFGDPGSLVVIDGQCARHYDRDKYEVTDISDRHLYRLYREKFGDPRFTPRVESGVVDHMALVEL
jgi:hypothetical protein